MMNTKQKDRKQRWTSERWCMLGGKARLGGRGGLGHVLRNSEGSGRRMLKVGGLEKDQGEDLWV